MLLSGTDLLPLLERRISDEVLDALIDDHISRSLHHTLPRVASLNLLLEAFGILLMLLVLIKTYSWSSKVYLLQQLNVVLDLLGLFALSVLVVERRFGIHELLR